MKPAVDMQQWTLDPDRYFDPDPTQRGLARQLYEGVSGLPIVSPHGHVDPALFSDPQAGFGSPADLFIIPDHYVFRMLHSQGVPLDALGVPRRDGVPTESDHRRIWRLFAEHFYLFRGTPSGAWLAQELQEVFGVTDKLDAASADCIYDHIAALLETPAFRPRALFERFNIEVLCTTDPPFSALEHHQAIRRSGWRGDIRPTFRMDGVVDLTAPGWLETIERLGQVVGISIGSFADFLKAVQAQRAFFKSIGATATDMAALTAHTEELSPADAEAIFKRALTGRTAPGDALRFTAGMLMESARMSLNDGLVMQIHVGSVRNHSGSLFSAFGPDKGADIPQAAEFTRSMRPLLEKYGEDPRLAIILFTLDEATLSRELAPLAGYYPALKLGPPWWFFDSLNGMRRYFDRVMETAGLYNTCGFNDDTRAFPSIPARHDVWRRASANWVAGLLVRGLIDEQDAQEMMFDLAYNLARRAYRLDGT
jgi:glucuronate isomerase